VPVSFEAAKFILASELSNINTSHYISRIVSKISYLFTTIHSQLALPIYYLNYLKEQQKGVGVH